MRNTFKILLLLFTITSCNPLKQVEPSSNTLDTQEELLMATLYQFFAEEYKAAAYQAYNTAQQRIDKLVKQYIDPTKMAVVVDIDETVLDNSPYQAKLIVENAAYPEYWVEWCNLTNAKAIPGAVSFLNYVDSLGFQIFYISNRKKKDVEAATMKNLAKEGFPQIISSHVLLREEKSETNPNPSSKEARRKLIIDQDIDIVMLIGDNLGDFYEDGKNSEAELNNLMENKSQFGVKYIVLPNAMYGNWPGRIGKADKSSADSLLKIMTACFNQPE
jgi:5'-nucleotidase (lipoprotein e(P4) family)